MFVLIVLLLGISSVAISPSQAVNDPNQWMSFLISSLRPLLPATGDEHHGLHVIEYIIKHVSRIPSSERFIDNIVNRQRGASNKLQVLIFLNRCFRITQKVLQRNLDRLLDHSSTSVFSSLLTVEDLQRAQAKVQDLLRVIEKRMTMLKTWVPPTVPFLGL